MSTDLPVGMNYIPADLEAEGVFRSEPMQLIQFIIQVDAVHDTLDELGQIGAVEFKDLNPGVNAFQRNFVNEVKRCDEMERKLRYLRHEINLADVEREHLNLPPFSLLIDRPSEINEDSLDMDDLEAELESYEAELKEMSNNRERLKRQQLAAEETKFVLERAADFFNEVYSAERAASGVTEQSGDVESQTKTPLLSDHDGEGGSSSSSTTTTTTAGIGFGFVTGVIERERMPVFERVLWRATRGNLFMKQAEIEQVTYDPQTNQEVEKNVFMIFSQGERIRNKIRKICDSFNAHLYDCPDTYEARDELAKQTDDKLREFAQIMKHTDTTRNQQLKVIAKSWKPWLIKVRKELAIFHTMNMFDYDVTQKCLVGEGWVPLSMREEVTQRVRNGTQKSGGIVPSIMNPMATEETPPTAFKENKFTTSFQLIVDAYGVARYREMNPTPFTCITFPFLFAIMFGDLGHGFLMTLFALWLVMNEKKFGSMKLGEMSSNIFRGRYVILLMSIFAMYVGWLYNETFSLPIDWWGTNWMPQDAAGQLATRIDPDRTYEFGVDPIWNGAVNELIYYNSLKMKVSIIFGVIQMMFGIFLSAGNAKDSGHMIDFWAGFIPQLLFFSCLFGYLTLCIFIKWLTPYPNTNLAPSLLQFFIAFAMSPGSITPETRVYPGQEGIGVVLILLAVICIPWMLVPKPMYEKKQFMKKVAQGEALESDFVYSDIIIHQFIHAAEFILGCISHTASYLRLWALSLAHSELAKVFWEQIMHPMLYSGSAVGLIIGFIFFSGATTGVLLMMESGSAFFHALRLHWVEFQSKFFHGDGYAFRPFTFAKITHEDEGN